jgi:hypothetical protein
MYKFDLKVCHPRCVDGPDHTTLDVDYLPEEEIDDIPAPGTPVRQ